MGGLPQVYWDVQGGDAEAHRRAGTVGGAEGGAHDMEAHQEADDMQARHFVTFYNVARYTYMMT